MAFSSAGVAMVAGPTRLALTMTFSPCFVLRPCTPDQASRYRCGGLCAGSHHALSYPFGSPSPARRHALEPADVCAHEMEGSEGAPSTRSTYWAKGFAGGPRK